MFKEQLETNHGFKKYQKSIKDYQMEQTKYLLKKLTADRFKEKYLEEVAPNKFQKGQQKLTELNAYFDNKYAKKDEKDENILKQINEQIRSGKRSALKQNADGSILDPKQQGIFNMILEAKETSKKQKIVEKKIRKKKRLSYDEMTEYNVELQMNFDENLPYKVDGKYLMNKDSGFSKKDIEAKVKDIKKSKLTQIMERQMIMKVEEYNPKDIIPEEEEPAIILPETEEIARNIDFGPDLFKEKMTEIRNKIKWQKLGTGKTFTMTQI